MGAKQGLPAGAVRLLRLCDSDVPVRLQPDENSVARVLEKLGLLQRLPGCESTYDITDAGRARLREYAEPKYDCPRCGDRVPADQEAQHWREKHYRPLEPGEDCRGGADRP